MKFLCDRSRLEAAVAPILPAIPAKDSPKPALKSLHLRVEKDALVLQGSNMELSIETRIDTVKVERPGSCLVPARQFHAIIREVADPTVRIEQRDGTLVIPTSSGKFEIVTGDAADFPELRFAEGEGPLGLPTELLARHFQATEFASAREATRYAMNGILLVGRHGKLTTVATDGRRLALISSALDDPDAITDGSEGWHALLPHRSLGAAVKAMDSLREDSVAVQVGETSVTFAMPQLSIAIQKVAGAFPEYDTVIPRDCGNVVEFNRVLLEANLRRATVLTEEMNPAVKMSFEGTQARFESEAAGVGSAETTMEVSLTGAGGHIIFNPHFITDVLRVAQQEVVRFEFDDASSPGKFVLGEEFVYVVMPITGI